MQTELHTAIHRYLSEGGCSDEQIAQGVAYADEVGYRDWDDALRIALARILYTREACDEGARAPVEPGIWYADSTSDYNA